MKSSLYVFYKKEAPINVRSLSDSAFAIIASYDARSPILSCRTARGGAVYAKIPPAYDGSLIWINCKQKFGHSNLSGRRSLAAAGLMSDWRSREHRSVAYGRSSIRYPSLFQINTRV